MLVPPRLGDGLAQQPNPSARTWQGLGARCPPPTPGKDLGGRGGRGHAGHESTGWPFPPSAQGTKFISCFKN